jgi:hypothetical protein
MKRSPWFHILGLICAVGGSIACATLVPTGQATPTIPIESIPPTFTPVPEIPDDGNDEKGDTGDARWIDQLEKAEGEWQALGITSYRIEVMVTSIWHAQTYKLTVREGEVVEESASCIPAPSKPPITPSPVFSNMRVQKRSLKVGSSLKSPSTRTTVSRPRSSLITRISLMRNQAGG